MKRLLSSEYLVCVFCIVYFLAMIPFVPGWTSGFNLANILHAVLPLLIIAIGQMLVMLTAGIDLSVTAVVAMASVVGASIMSQDTGYLGDSAFATVAGGVAMIGVGAVIGAINGLSVTKARMPAFMVTLATWMFFSGLAIWYTSFHTAAFSSDSHSSSSIAGLPDSFIAFWEGPTSLFSGDDMPNRTIDQFLPHALWVTLFIVIVAHLLLTKTVFGRSLYAVGLNPKAAHISGISVNRTILVAYILCACCAAIGSILYTSQQWTGDPKMGDGKLLDVIGATVIGGTSLFGGKGKIPLVFFGVLFLVMIDTSLSMKGLPAEVVSVTKGAVILLAAILDATRHRM